MADQEKERKTKKSPQKGVDRSKDSPSKSSKTQKSEVVSSTSKDSEPITEAMQKQTISDETVKVLDVQDSGDKKTSEADAQQNEKSDNNAEADNKEDDDNEEAPTLSGWLAYGFSSIVKSAKDTVQKSGTLESIKRDLVELKATVQSTSASSVLTSTASMVKNTLNEIGATVNEISSLGTSLGPEEAQDGQEEEASKLPKSASQSSSLKKSPSEEVSVSSDEASLFNFSTLNSFAHKFGESARSTLTAVKDVVVDSLALKNDNSLEELEDDAFVYHNGVALPLPELRSQLAALLVDGRTFIKEPEGTPEAYEEWLSKFSLIDYEKQMEHLISNVPELASIRETLVPGQLTENDFWHRYYYKAHLLKLKLKQEAVERFEKQQQAEKIKADKEKEKAELPSKPASVASSDESAAHLSRSSTDDWDKVDGGKTSDDEKDWVKCD